MSRKMKRKKTGEEMHKSKYLYRRKTRYRSMEIHKKCNKRKGNTINSMGHYRNLSIEEDLNTK
jgi:hypothetical protein